jgi:hypothetical protein
MSTDSIPELIHCAAKIASPAYFLRIQQGQRFLGFHSQYRIERKNAPRKRKAERNILE